MFDQIAILRLAGHRAEHAAQRQGLVAQNVANADTPGYRARDLPTFSETYRAGFDTGPRQTRIRHMDGGTGIGQARPVEANGQAAPNGNTVSLETEMLRAVDVKRDHDRALAVYRASLDVLRSALGRPR